MNTKTTLAQHLRKMAEVLGHVKYHWHTPDCCNCGILARVITGMNTVQLFDALVKCKTRLKNTDAVASWTEVSALHCPISGLSENELFRQLGEAGMALPDFYDLEYLANERVIPDALRILNTGKRWWQPKLKKLDKTSSKHVRAYCIAWADVLDADAAKFIPSDAELFSGKVDAPSAFARQQSPSPTPQSLN